MRPRAITVCCAIALASGACGARAPADPGPDLQIVGEATVIRFGDPVPATSPWFDGAVVRLAAARGETVAFQVLHRGGGTAQVTFAPVTSSVRVRAFAVGAAHVTRPSTDLYGGSRGAGDYPDVLIPVKTVPSNPAYFELAVAADAPRGTLHGTLVVDGRAVPLELDVSGAVMPPLPVEGVWAYEDPRELAWSGLPPSDLDAPSGSERACIRLFADYGVLLSPDLPVSAWAARRDLLAGAPAIPARISDDPAAVGSDVRAWLAAPRGPDQVPFAIPIDEPADAAARGKVVALADAVHAAGSGFVYAVTAAPAPELRGHVDRFISPAAGSAAPRWTYNGKPPGASAMVVDAAEPGLRTWGWIAARYHVATWYVWDALYWHDRHNRKRSAVPPPGRALDVGRDAVSFDDGGDHGNLDGVLAIPGDANQPCRPTLRLAALRRGLQDAQLYAAARACDPAAAELVLARVIPRALDEAHGAPAWPASDVAFEAARRELLLLAAACANRK